MQEASLKEQDERTDSTGGVLEKVKGAHVHLRLQVMLIQATGLFGRAQWLRVCKKV